METSNGKILQHEYARLETPTPASQFDYRWRSGHDSRTSPTNGGGYATTIQVRRPLDQICIKPLPPPYRAIFPQQMGYYSESSQDLSGPPQVRKAMEKMSANGKQSGQPPPPPSYGYGRDGKVIRHRRRPRPECRRCTVRRIIAEWGKDSTPRGVWLGIKIIGLFLNYVGGFCFGNGLLGLSWFVRRFC